MEIVARQQQPLPEVSAYVIIRQALDDVALLSKFLPNLTDDGKLALEAAGIDNPEQQNEFLQVLNLAVTGAQQRNAAAQQLAAQQSYAAGAYTTLVKAQTDAVLVSQLWPKVSDEGKRALEAAGISRPEQQSEFLQILNLAAAGVQFQGGNQRRFDETMDVVSEMKNGLKETIRQIDLAFNIAMGMYVLSFCVGLALIGVAVWFAQQGKDTLSTVLGGFGAANTLTFFFTKPPERLQSSRASLAQLQCALIAWFTDIINQSSVLTQLNQEQISKGEKLDPARYDRIFETLMRHTEDIMKMLQKYCKLVENPMEPEGRRVSRKLHVPAARADSSAEADSAAARE